MADDLFVHKGYAVHDASGSALKSAGYVIATGTASATKSSGYIIVGQRASDSTAKGYAILKSVLPPYTGLVLEGDFVDERFPECVSFGSSGGPGFRTSIFEMDSGYTSGNAEWDRIRSHYEVTFQNATPEDVTAVDSFFYGMRGQGVAFRYKDHSDYQISNQNMGVGNGSATEFLTFKRYSSGGYDYDRPIKKLVAGTVTGVTVGGVSKIENTDYFVIPNLGMIKFTAPPAKGDIVFVGYIEFDVPVRFATDTLSVTTHAHLQHDVQGLSLVEVLVG